MHTIRKYSHNKNKISMVNIVILCIFILVISLSIGFSSMYSSLDIGQLAAYFRINKDIRITNIALDSTKESAISNWEEYDTKNISASFSLPNSSSEVTYQVEITNIGNIEMGLFDITGLPQNLEYKLDNYTMKDMLCDSTDSSLCKLGSKSYVNITILYNDNSYDSSNTDFNVNLNFDFKRFYTISYINIDDTNLPTKVMEDDDLEFYLNSPFPSRVHFNGNVGASYNSSNGKISLVDVSDDVTISYITTSYFVAYDGASNNIFGTFDKTNITRFERNTTLSRSEVMNKVNNNTAFKISTDDNDQNYPSDQEVYGWVDNNKLYWWSEADMVYFHPNTLGAFRLMTKLTYVDLNGTNTSLVKNFAHWFDKDALLTTINGKINTSGVVLEYNPSFNYGNDQDENSSSGFGLTYMFNDCKVLTSIDTSEIDTTNSSDLKRMFGGCAKLTSLDVSHFNTSNARSMYWMFRKNEKLTELDLRSFDTSKVESMYGMFISTINLKTLYLGENFDTSKVKQFNRMFESSTNLTTIYAYHDFSRASLVTGPNMFSNAKKLVGSAGTLDETVFDSSHIDISYAKLAQNGVKGYLTPYDDSEKYTITYDVDGALHNNPTIYTANTQTFTLDHPQKTGYVFIGWTGSNGDTPELDVTIEQGSTGNRHYIAHYEAPHEDLFPKVFYIAGSCNFNGSNTNITGSTCVSSLDDHTDYTNSTYIDTNISLYNSENYQKDFEIYFEISNYNPAEQENPPGCNGQNTNATLSTTTGSSVSYDLSILNKGTLDARLESVNFDDVAITCSNAPAGSSTLIEGVAGAGTTSTGGNSTTISNADCAKMFGVSLSIGGTTYDTTPASIASSTIAAGGSAPVVLTVSYKDTADARAIAATLDGDIVVTLGSISVGYTSTTAS